MEKSSSCSKGHPPLQVTLEEAIFSTHKHAPRQCAELPSRELYVMGAPVDVCAWMCA